jgi:hypothetical protein
VTKDLLVHTQELNTANSGATCLPTYILGLFTAAILQNQHHYPSIEERIKKSAIYMCSISSHKNEILSFSRKYVELEIIMLSEINQMQKDKYYMSFSHMWNLQGENT